MSISWFLKYNTKLTLALADTVLPTIKGSGAGDWEIIEVTLGADSQMEKSDPEMERKRALSLSSRAITHRWR